MLFIILKYLCLTLAISFSGMALSSIALFCSFISILDPEKSAGPDGRFRATLSTTWMWFLVGFFWAAFFFLGTL